MAGAYGRVFLRQARRHGAATLLLNGWLYHYAPPARLDQIEAFARSLTRRRVFTLMDLSFTGGSLIAGERLKVALEQELSGFLIEQLETPFAAIATEVGTGHEVWLQRGSLSLAIRASYALPGIFEPVRVADRWLFDGALVNPISVFWQSSSPFPFYIFQV